MPSKTGKKRIPTKNRSQNRRPTPTRVNAPTLSTKKSGTGIQISNQLPANNEASPGLPRQNHREMAILFGDAMRSMPPSGIMKAGCAEFMLPTTIADQTKIVPQHVALERRNECRPFSGLSESGWTLLLAHISCASRRSGGLAIKTTATVF